MPRRHVLLAVAVAVVWGVNFVAIHVGLKDFPPLLFAALRYALVALPAVFLIARPPIPLRYVVAVGLALAAGTQGLTFVGMDAGMPAGLASLVLQVQAAFTLGLAVAFLGERPGRRQVAGAAVAMAGIALIAVGRDPHHVPLGALLLCVGGAFAWAAGNVLTRVARAPDALALLVWSSLFAPAPLLAASLAFEGPAAIGESVASPSLAAIAALLFVVIGATFFGFGSWTWLLARHPASKVAPFSLLVPVFGMGSAALALGERPGAIELTGGAIVLGGLGMVSLALRTPRRPLPPVATATVRS